MASLTVQEMECLRSAVEKRRKDEPFERSLGRALRNEGLDFTVYVKLVSEIRELAKSKKIDLDAAALELAAQEEEDR